MKIYLHTQPLRAEISDIAPDKSVSHRSAIFSLLSNKPSYIKNYLLADDTLSTLEILKTLGAKVEQNKDEISITPPDKFNEPNRVLECGNSGTTMRIFTGFLASKDGFFVLSGDKYLNERPMKRVCEPLKSVGAKIDGRVGGDKAPLAIRGGDLDYFEYESKIASAQVKTALILAGLNSKGCRYFEPELSRDHSERILKGMGAEILNDGLALIVKPLKKPLDPLVIYVPNDPSSGFFFAVAAMLIPGSKIVLKDMLINKTRIEAYNVLAKMGAKIEFIKKESKYEDIGDIVVEYSKLKGVEVKENISWLIDEAPALAVAFSIADGKSVIRNASELRVKECDRISVTVEALKACGVDAKELDDGFEIVGGSTLNSAIIDPHGDHRIAMSFAILGLKCGMIIEGSECINVSFPNFANVLKRLGVSVEN